MEICRHQEMLLSCKYTPMELKTKFNGTSLLFGYDSRSTQMVKNTFKGIICWLTFHLNNGLSEGVNNLIQSERTKGSGYRSEKNQISIIYLTRRKLKFNYHIPK